MALGDDSLITWNISFKFISFFVMSSLFLFLILFFIIPDWNLKLISFTSPDIVPMAINSPFGEKETQVADVFKSSFKIFSIPRKK